MPHIASMVNGGYGYALVIEDIGGLLEALPNKEKASAVQELSYLFENVPDGCGSTIFNIMKLTMARGTMRAISFIVEEFRKTEVTYMRVGILKRVFQRAAAESLRA